MRERKEPLRELLRELKQGPCLDCGGSFPSVCMQWDHRDPATKRHNVSTLVSYASRERLLAEIALCDLVCANCHAIRTEARRVAMLSSHQ
jgi:hypothetical protein